MEKKILRAERELLAISRQGRASQFLIVADLMQRLRQKYFVSPGAGCMGGSYVCFVLQITEIDPFKYGLMFERFMSEDDEWFSGFYLEMENEAVKEAQKTLLETCGSLRDIELCEIQQREDAEETIFSYMNSLASIDLQSLQFQFQEDVMAFMQRELFMSPSESNRMSILLAKCDVEAQILFKQRMHKAGFEEDSKVFIELDRTNTYRFSKAWFVSRTLLIDKWKSNGIVNGTSQMTPIEVVDFMNNEVDFNMTDCSPEQLRNIVRALEAQIKQIVGPIPMWFFRKRCNLATYKRLEYALSKRKLALNTLFCDTEEEQERKERLNNLIYDLQRKLLKRTANLYRTTVLKNRDKEFDDDYEIHGILQIGCEYTDDIQDDGGVLKLDNDNVYASDFPYMISVIKEFHSQGRKNNNWDLCGNDYFWECGILTIDVDDKVDIPDNRLFRIHYPQLSDDLSWSEKRNAINVTSKRENKMSEPTKALFDTYQLSWADAVRIDSFCAEAGIICQRITDSRNRPYMEIMSDIQNK